MFEEGWRSSVLAIVSGFAFGVCDCAADPVMSLDRIRASEIDDLLLRLNKNRNVTLVVVPAM